MPRKSFLSRASSLFLVQDGFFYSNETTEFLQTVIYLDRSGADLKPNPPVRTDTGTHNIVEHFCLAPERAVLVLECAMLTRIGFPLPIDLFLLPITD